MDEAWDKATRCPKCGSENIEDTGDSCGCRDCGARFPSPMRLFISYGRTESDKCRRIAAALEDRGHRVWFDTEDIGPGDDWRWKITDAIAGSDAVIACLSAHSTREESVCQDELAIAARVLGGSVKPVLLEPRDRLGKVQDFVSRIQKVDMSQWDELEKQDPAAFAQWFRDKMDELSQAVGSPECRRFIRQIKYIRGRLDIKDDDGSHLPPASFVGREWLTDETDRWLDDPQGEPLCLLAGGPGTGKSAFAAAYARRSQSRVAAFFSCAGTDEPRTVIMTLAYQLARRQGDYCTQLTERLEKLGQASLDGMDAGRLFDTLLVKPLAGLIRSSNALCIVLDGLDERGQGGQNALADALARYAGGLPGWLRIFVTAQNAAALGAAPPEKIRRLALPGDHQEQNRQDLRQYFVRQLADMRRDDVGWDIALDKLVKRSEGIFLYAVLLADAVRQGGSLSLRDAGAPADGFSGAFRRWFASVFPDLEEYRARFRLPLGVLLAAPEPLPVYELTRIFGPDGSSADAAGAPWDENDVNDFLRRAGILLQEGRGSAGERTVSFRHRYLYKWLDTEQAAWYRSSRQAAARRMADRFYGLFRRDGRYITDYEARHMLPLLRESGQFVRRKELSEDQGLYWALVNAGDRARARGSLDTAARCYFQALDVGEAMVKRDEPPARLSVLRRDLCLGYIRSGNLLEETGQLVQAQAQYSKAASVTEQMAAEQDSPEIRRNLALNHKSAAAVLEKLLKQTPKNTADADRYRQDMLGHYEKAIQPLEAAWLPEGPDDWLLSYCCEKAADILKKTSGQPAPLDQAMRYYEKALSIAGRQTGGQDVRGQRRLYFLCGKMGITLQNLALLEKSAAQKHALLDRAAQYLEQDRALCGQLVREQGMQELERDLKYCEKVLASVRQEQDRLAQEQTATED